MRLSWNGFSISNNYIRLETMNTYRMLVVNEREVTGRQNLE